MTNLNHLPGYSILRLLLAEFRIKHLNLDALDAGYEGMSRQELEDALRATGQLGNLDFTFAFEELESNGFISTGPQKHIENDRHSTVVFLGFFKSEYKYTCLTQEGYKAALQCSTDSFRTSPRCTLTSMDIDFFFPDHLSAFDSDGAHIAPLRAQITSSREILIYGDAVAIRPGYWVSRKLPNGIEEKFEVLDAHYSPGHGHDLPAVTRLDVKKIGSRANSAPNATHINVSGIGARVNLNSDDRSSNSYSINSPEVFTELLTMIASLQDGPSKDELKDAANDLKSAVGTTKYGQTFQRFLQAAQTFMPLVTPFLPELAKHLQ